MIPDRWRWSLKYAKVTIKHKWFVFLACRIMGVPLWRALVHDLSKFTPAELPHYGRQFFGDKGDPIGFAAAWLHHQNVNPHHWEYWIPRTGSGRHTGQEDVRICAISCPEMGPYSLKRGPGKTEEELCPEVLSWEQAKEISAAIDAHRPLPMPETYAREMIADWMGASRAYTGSWHMADWLVKNLPKLRLHPDTVERLWLPLLDVVHRYSGLDDANRVLASLRQALKNNQ